MILKRFYEDRLAQASFLLGCPTSGEAIVIDSNRDIEPYISAARSEGLRITTVTETHIHADFVSGSRELASRTGAVLAVSGEGGPDWQYSFAGQPGVKLLRDGDMIRAGSVCLTVKHTPGHTPEHLAFLLTDQATAPEPVGAFSGDFIFAGDVGRPDLLERAAGISGTMEAGARQLFRSLNSVRELPDRLLLWPGHGAGSACGKKLGGMPVTTLGYERIANWAFQVEDESQFVRQILEDQPEPPRYFAAMKRINKIGAGTPASAPARLSTEALAAALRDHAVQVVDLRPAANFAEGFIPGSISIPLNKSFLNWAGALLLPEPEIYLLGEERQVREATAALTLIGLDHVSGWLEPEVIEFRRNRRGDLARMEQIDAARVLERQKKGQLVLDVRAATEFREGHIPGAVHIPLGCLPEEAAALSRDSGIVVHCQGGARSPIALSILRRLGFHNVANFPGGFADYQRQGLPVETGAATDLAGPVSGR
ncbi:MAG TPA: rhodanese-like domain-containing protein [Candidatus Angelobacter sp.]|nr:rhodanese-like domain-containing protein [Candidatus Angelobacter sp.]